MAVKNLIKVFAKSHDCELKKEKEKHRLSPPNCTAMVVGLGEEKKRYEVPNKFLSSILPVLVEDELDRKIDGPIRIYCSTDFFDQILKALRDDIDNLSLLVNEDFRNLCT